MFIHDLIKIKYTHMGYLPDYRVELISDVEMCDAFLCYDRYYRQKVLVTVIDIQHQIDTLKERICDVTCTICEYKTRIVTIEAQMSSLDPNSNLYKELLLEKERLIEAIGTEEPPTGLYLNLQTLNAELLNKQQELELANEQAVIDTAQFDDDFLHGKYSCYFCDTYPLIDDSLLNEYKALVFYIRDALRAFTADKTDDHVLPDWIYTYMMGEVVGPLSTKLDIHDLLVLLDMDNKTDTFTVAAANACYAISIKWLTKLTRNDLKDRPATIFGEPHVIKALRLQYIFE